MSEKNSPDQNKPQNGGNKLVMFALLAGVLGLGVGAGLYAVSKGNDNVETADAAGCAIDPALQAKLNTAATGEVAAFRATDKPFSVANFSFNDASGTKKLMSRWQGKTVLFNLWATWCAPCRAEMPALDALNKELGGDNFEVVPVSVDLGEPDKPKKFYKDIGLTSVGFFHDPELASLNVLKKNGLAYGLPATLLINGKGCVLGTLNGPAEWAGEDAKKLVKAAL